MRIDLPRTALDAGMSNEPSGTHTSRTIMLDELAALLASCSPDAEYQDYATAAVDTNVLGKATLAIPTVAVWAARPPRAPAWRRRARERCRSRLIGAHDHG